MKEHQILFSTPMVQANLEGRKTQTRRTKGLEKINESPDDWFWINQHKRNLNRFWNTEIEACPNPLKTFFVLSNNVGGHEIEIECPYGQPGDLLWVREKFAKTMGVFEPEICYSFFADDFHWSWQPGDVPNGKTSCQWHDPDLSKEVKWKPSIHMPKEAARIWLQITDVKAERLQDISEEDAIAEGICCVDDSPVLYENYLFNKKKAMWPGFGNITKTYGFTNPYHSFRSLIEKINGAQSWDANPWVWAIKYKVISTTGKPSFDYAQCKKSQIINQMTKIKINYGKSNIQR